MSWKAIIGTALVLGIGGSLTYSCVSAWETKHEYANCSVTGKDRTSTQYGSQMRIYTNCGVFSVADDLIQNQWNSADTYAKIAVGKTYNFETVGWRNGFLSDFPNIIALIKGEQK